MMLSSSRNFDITTEPFFTRNREAFISQTSLGNVKNAMTETYHCIGKKHVPGYLAEFEYRFYRRFDLPAMVLRLAHAAKHPADALSTDLDG